MSYRPQRRRRQNEHLLLQRLLVTSIIGGSLALLMALAAFLLFEAAYGNKIYPGVSVAGTDLGGQTPREAALHLSNSITYPYLGQVIVSGPENQQWAMPPSQLGLMPDPAGTTAAAYEIGRRGGFGQRFSEQFSALTRGVAIAPRFIFDQQQAKSALHVIGTQVEKPQVEPAIQMNGTEVVVIPGQNGLALNIEDTVRLIEERLPTQDNFRVALQTVVREPAVLDVEAQADKARALLSEPLTINMPAGQDDQKGPWTIDQATLASMLTFSYGRNPEGNLSYMFNMKRDQLIRFLATISPELQRLPAEPRFIFNDDTKVLDLHQPGVVGRVLNVDRSLEAINTALMEGQHAAELQFDLTEPRVKDDATGESLGIIENTHIEYSYFYGSAPERVQNIIASSSNFHGLLIAPGETFSMANAMADITLDNGYAEAPIIVGGRTVEGIGGGVCQVSTTLFRAAFNAGYPIVERHPHAYRVGYYEQLSGPRWSDRLAGLDATVFVPIVDFKFRNDSPNWLLMETYVYPEQFTIMWKFYSTSDGRQVEWSTTGPMNIVEAPKPAYEENSELPTGTIKQVDWAAEGAEVTVKRTVRRGGEVIIDDTFYTKYEPWRAVYQYGPGTEGIPSPSDDASSE